MRTSKATITLQLKTSKTLATGLNPVIVRVCWKGMKTKNTGYSCKPSQWNDGRFNSSYPDHVKANKELEELLMKYIKARDYFVRERIAYTAQMILDSVEEVSTLTSLKEKYCMVNGISRKTVENYTVVVNSFIRFHGDSYQGVDTDTVKSYATSLQRKGTMPSTIANYLSKLMALFGYARDKQLIERNPFDGFSYQKKYRNNTDQPYIDAATIDIMISLLMDEHSKEKLRKFHSAYFAKYLYILSYHMCGLAPVDLALLKKEDFKRRIIDDKNYLAVDKPRTKTGVTFKIRLQEDDELTEMLVKDMLESHEGKFFLPILNGYEDKPLDVQKKRIQNFYQWQSKKLKEWFKEVNSKIEKYRLDVPPIDSKCTYYSARHSWVMAMASEPDVNFMAMATKLGKSTSSLYQYFSSIIDEKDLL